MASLIEEAKRARGRSRRCNNCPLLYCMCNPEVAKVCTDNFIEGFIKGAKFIQSKMKNNESKGKSNR